MDGRNCTGRKISLLNDSGNEKAAVPTKPALLSQVSNFSQYSAHSRSYSRTPSLSPQTPQLVRSNSSTDSRTPSPLTPPAYNSFGAPSHHSISEQSPRSHYFFPRYSKMDDQNASLYPPIPDASATMSSAYTLPPQIAPQQVIAQQPAQSAPQSFQRTSTSPSSEPSRVSTASANSNSKPVPKKNQYPCPMAKQVGCTDYFTTSGHAARHAKKHTGKKDAFCPECNKAFTRKDNMEQHRRTHQNGRGASRSVNNDDSKVKKSTKPAAKKLKADPLQLEAAVEQELANQIQVSQSQQAILPISAQLPVTQQQLTLDQSLLLPPAGPYFLGSIDSGPVPSLPMAMPDLTPRPPLVRSNFTDSLGYMAPPATMIDPESLHYSYPSPGLSNGLNSLALAASEHQRLNEKSSSVARSPGSESNSDVTP